MGPHVERRMMATTGGTTPEQTRKPVARWWTSPPEHSYQAGNTEAFLVPGMSHNPNLTAKEVTELNTKGERDCEGKKPLTTNKSCTTHSLRWSVPWRRPWTQPQTLSSTGPAGCVSICSTSSAVSNSPLTSFRGVYFSRKVFTSFKSMLSEVNLKNLTSASSRSVVWAPLLNFMYLFWFPLIGLSGFAYFLFLKPVK